MTARRRPRAASRTVVVGLGNPVLGDDGVGWRVAEELERRLSNGQALDPDTASGHGRAVATVQMAAIGGLSLMERLVGFDQAILVDAIAGSGDPPGTVTVRDLADLATRSTGHLDSAHDAPLPLALRAGRALGASLPRRITVVGVAADGVDTFDDQLSPAVRAAVSVAAERVVRLLEDDR